MKCVGLAAAIIGTLVSLPGTANAVASAELYKTQAYVYGRFEARIRFAAGDGVISSFFLWKDGSEGANVFWNELDFEKVGADCHMETNAIYGNPEALHSQENEMPGDICSEYHDYRFEWTPTYIAWVVDGKEVRRETGATADAFSQNATSGMTFRFNVWPGNADFGGNFSPSILPVREHISWVSYSSYSNGSFQLEWREDFNGTSLPSGWATGSWASPYSLSTHKPANVTVANGIVTLSLTADDATGFSGTPPADDAGTGGTTTGGTASGGTSAGGNGSRGGTSSTGGATSARGGNASQSSGTEPAGTGGTRAIGGAASTASGVTKGGNLSTGGSSGKLSSASGSTRRTDAGGQSSGGSAARQTGGSRTTTTVTSEGTTSERGGSTSNSASVGTHEPTATSAVPDNSGCACRLPDHSDRTRSRVAFELLGLMGLIGLRRAAGLRRRARSTRP